MSESSQKSLKNIQPLEVMGYFWFLLGVVVLIGTPFIKGSETLPQIRGVVTNLVAAAILLIIGLATRRLLGKIASLQSASLPPDPAHILILGIISLTTFISFLSIVSAITFYVHIIV